MNKEIDSFFDALLTLDRVKAQNILEEQLKHQEPINFIENIVVVALEKLGEDWLNGKVALSQVYMAGRICEQLIDTILPPEAPERKDQPKMAICVLSDHHGLGKTIVYSLLRASGFELTDFGTVEVDEVIEKIIESEIKILLISVLMLPSALKIKTLKDKLAAQGIMVKLVVGGAPFRFDKQLWKEVGADASCDSASEAVATIEQLIKGEK